MGLLPHLVDGPARERAVLLTLKGVDRHLGRSLVVTHLQRRGFNDLVTIVPLPQDDAHGGVGGDCAGDVDGLVVDEIGGGRGEAHRGVCGDGRGEYREGPTANPCRESGGKVDSR